MWVLLMDLVTYTYCHGGEGLLAVIQNMPCDGLCTPQKSSANGITCKVRTGGSRSNNKPDWLAASNDRWTGRRVEGDMNHK